jgi:hypothetical protein
MKKGLVFVFLLLLCSIQLPAQDLSPIGNDFSVIFKELGNEIIPNLQLTSLSGNGVADAELGTFPAFYFSLSTGAALSNGVEDFINRASDRTELLNPSSFLNAAGLSEGNKVYDFISNFLPYPYYRLAAGFGIVSGIEALFQFSILPQSLSNAILGLAKLEGVTLNSLNIGGQVRKVLLNESKILPAASLGVGYAYSNLNMGYPLSTLESISLSDGNLTLSGDIKIKGMIHSFGLGFHLSKKLLFFRPFLSVAPYLQKIYYRGAVDQFNAVLSDGVTELASYADSGGDDPVGVIDDWDLSIIISSGFEFVIGKFIFFTHGHLNPADMLISAEIGFRFQN